MLGKMKLNLFPRKLKLFIWTFKIVSFSRINGGFLPSTIDIAICSNGSLMLVPFEALVSKYASPN